MQLVHIQEEVTVVIDLTIRRQDHPQIFCRRVVHRQLVLGYVAQMNGSVRTAEHGLLPAPQKVAVEGAVLDTQCANDGTVGLVADHGLPAARFFLQHHQHIVIGAAGVVVGHFGPQVHIHRAHMGGVHPDVRAVRQRIVELPVQGACAHAFQAAEMLDPELQRHAVEQLAVVDHVLNVPFVQHLFGGGQETDDLAGVAQRLPAHVEAVVAVLLRQADKAELAHEPGTEAQHPLIVLLAVVPIGGHAGIAGHDVQMQVALVGGGGIVAAPEVRVRAGRGGGQIVAPGIQPRTGFFQHLIADAVAFKFVRPSRPAVGLSVFIVPGPEGDAGAVAVGLEHLVRFLRHGRKKRFRLRVNAAGQHEVAPHQNAVLVALAQMKHVIIAEKGHVLFLLGFFVLHLEEFPENHHMGLFALADAAARLLNLLEGGVFSRLTQQHLIQQGIGLAGGVADRLSGRDPRFLPRDDTLLHLRKNPVCDFGVYVQFSLLPFLRGARRLW